MRDNSGVLQVPVEVGMKFMVDTEGGLRTCGQVWWAWRASWLLCL
jgi:hypothetical protein